MKKSLLALAAFSAFAGAASAQTNTTVYGIIDIGLTQSKSDVAATRWGIDSGNWYGSRLGFKGSEDLGNGLSAVFMLENGFSADTGALGQSGRLFAELALPGRRDQRHDAVGEERHAVEVGEDHDGERAGGERCEPHLLAALTLALQGEAGERRADGTLRIVLVGQGVTEIGQYAIT